MQHCTLSILYMTSHHCTIVTSHHCTNLPYPAHICISYYLHTQPSLIYILTFSAAEQMMMEVVKFTT
jgi:hypothetical protein